VIFPWFKAQGLRQLDDSDVCVWVYDDPKGNEMFAIGCYVDNLVIAHSAEVLPDGTADPSSFYSRFTKALCKRWDVLDEGPLDDLLGMEVKINDDGSITVHQSKYVRKLLDKYLPDGLPDCIPGPMVDAPLPYSPRIRELVDEAAGPHTKGSPPPHPELIKPFQEMVGAVMYLCNSTRPDLA
jgi:hypothetical protein